MHTATALFAEKGFENTSLALVCKKAEVSKGLIFHHFESKNDLLRQIFSQTTELMIRMNTSNEAQANPKTRLLELIKGFFSQLKTDKLFFQLNLNIMLQPGTREVLSDLIAERSSYLLTSAQGLFKELFPTAYEVKSYMFIAELDGIALNYLCIFQDYPLDSVSTELLHKYEAL